MSSCRATNANAKAGSPHTHADHDPIAVTPANRTPTSHAHVPDEPASVLRPATLEAAREHVTIEGVPYRERLFALLSDPTATLADLEAALGAVPGVKVHALVPVHRQGWGRDAASVLCESVLVTSPRGALEVTRTTDSYGRTQWSAPWVGPSVAELPRVGPQGVLARLSCLEVQP